jgi:hypothetical protein
LVLFLLAVEDERQLLFSNSSPTELLQEICGMPLRIDVGSIRSRYVRHRHAKKISGEY